MQEDLVLGGSFEFEFLVACFQAWSFDHGNNPTWFNVNNSW